MRNFRELNIWLESIKIVKQIYEITSFLPSEEKFGLKSQMQRASVSISSNIAEGCSRNSNIEFKRFLEIAIGSSFELETQLVIICELKFIENEKIQNVVENINKLQKMINSFISKLIVQNQNT
jgi:four helix bundle protein